MPGFTDSVETQILNHFTNKAAWTAPTSLFIGLSSTTPNEAGGNITEPTGGAYARVATVAADWNTATGTAPVSATTATVRTFPTATADWLLGVNLTNAVLFSASTAGTALAYGALATPKPVLNGDTPNFPAGSIVVRIGDVGDPGL